MPDLFQLLALVVLALNQSWLSGSLPLDQLRNARWVILAFLATRGLFRMQRRSGSPNAADFFALAFVVLCLASAAYSDDPSLTLQRGTSIALLYAAVFVDGWVVADRLGARAVIGAIEVVGVFFVVVGFVIAPFSPDAYQSDGRFRGLFINPNSLGLASVILLPTLLLETSRLRWILLVGTVTGLIMTGSRGPVLTAALTMAAAFLSRPFRPRSRGHLALAALGLLGTVAIMQSWPDAGTSVVPERLRMQDLGTMSGRTEAWEIALDRIRHRPLIGHGFGTEELVFGEVGNPFRDFTSTHIHNSFLGLTYQVGLLGAVLMFGPLLMLGYWSVRALFSSDQAVTVAPALAVIAGISMCFSESWIYSVGNAFCLPYWLLAMLAYRTVRLFPPPNR